MHTCVNSWKFAKSMTSIVSILIRNVGADIVILGSFFFENFVFLKNVYLLVNNNENSAKKKKRLESKLINSKIRKILRKFANIDVSSCRICFYCKFAKVTENFW